MSITAKHFPSIASTLPAKERIHATTAQRSEQPPELSERALAALVPNTWLSASLIATTDGLPDLARAGTLLVSLGITAGCVAAMQNAKAKVAAALAALNLVGAGAAAAQYVTTDRPSSTYTVYEQRRRPENKQTTSRLPTLDLEGIKPVAVPTPIGLPASLMP